MEPTLIINAATCVWLAGTAIFVASRPDRTQLHGLLMTLLFGLMLWTGGYVLFLTVEPGPAASFAGMTLFLGVFTVPPVWLILAAHHTRVDLLDRRPGWLIAALVPTAMSALAVVTNPGHRLFVREFDPDAMSGPASEWAGLFFWLSLGWGILLSLIATGLYLGSAIRRVRAGETGRGVALMSVVLAPVVLSPLTGIYLHLDMTATFIGLSTVILFGLNWRHRVLETLPIARRDVIGHLVDGVVLTDASGVVLDVNPAAEKLIGRDAAECEGQLLPRVLSDFARDDHRRGVDTALDEMIATGAPTQIEFESTDGGFVEVTGAVVRAGDGEEMGFYALVRNRTARRRLEEILRQTQQLETTASLSAGIAHEIRNPLTFVQSNLSHIERVAAHMADEAKDEGRADEEALRDLVAAAEESLSGIERITAIIDRMRRMSRLDDGETTEIDVSQVVDDAIKMARLRSGSTLQVEVNEDSALPCFRGSAEHVVQVLLNVIDNARQALDGQHDGRIDIITRRVGQNIEIRVSDNGPGIPAEIQERIFDPFYTTKGPGEGTGLGLAISFGIVREHGGDLEFESLPGRGTEFTIRLPISAPAQKAPEI